MPTSRVSPLRRGFTRRVLPAGLAAGALAIATLVPVIATRASADDQADLAAAKAEVAAATARATETANRIARAETRQAALSDRIARVNRDMRDVRREVAFLEPIAKKRAIEAYQGLDPNAFEMFAEAQTLLDGARASEMLAASKEREDEAIEKLDQLRTLLASQSEALRADRTELDAVMIDLHHEQQAISQQLGVAQAAEEEVAARIAAAEAARRAEAKRRAEQEARRLAAARADDSNDATPTTTDSDRGTSGSDDDGSGNGSGGPVCPIDGPNAFADTWHQPRPGGRLHEGVDIFSPEGTPNVAVVSGTVSHGIGSLQGNGVYLAGDDGNSYWYFHLKSFATGAGRVDRGDTIGYTGDTGNAPVGAFHTHFEYHPGGGGPVNPYPLVSRLC